VDPSVLDRLGGQAPVWVIDPIDGTGNFVKGKAQFAVIVALVRDQSILQGWIHDPLLFRTSFAMQGAGAWCGGRRLGISNDRSVPLTGATAWRDRGKLEAAGLGVRQLGSAAHEYLALLDGSLDFSCYRRLHPWDHAAGVLLYQEAGGVARCLDGESYRPVPQDGSLLMAPDDAHWQSLRQLLGLDERIPTQSRKNT
jgi:fructose-1,6-bisphosphatase/inositol monophosphatase family enzyme